MFRITKDPSSGSSIQCLAKIAVMVLSCPLCLSRLCSTHTHHGQICCHNTDYVHTNGQDRTITVILAKHCIEPPGDPKLVGTILNIL